MHRLCFRNRSRCCSGVLRRSFFGAEGDYLRVGGLAELRSWMI